jgi:hypothetical protein
MPVERPYVIIGQIATAAFLNSNLLHRSCAETV